MVRIGDDVRSMEGEGEREPEHHRTYETPGGPFPLTTIPFGNGFAHSDPRLAVKRRAAGPGFAGIDCRFSGSRRMGRRDRETTLPAFDEGSALCWCCPSNDAETPAATLRTQPRAWCGEHGGRCASLCAPSPHSRTARSPLPRYRPSSESAPRHRGAMVHDMFAALMPEPSLPVLRIIGAHTALRLEP